MLYSIHDKNGLLAASDLFDMFTQSIKFYYAFHYQASRAQMFKKCDSSNKHKNEWLLLPPSFTAKFGLVFVSTLENAFS